MHEMGEMICLFGLIIAAIRVVLWLAGDKLFLGKLPGDIAIEKPGYSFHFPIVTCVMISLVLSLLLWLFRR